MLMLENSTFIKWQQKIFLGGDTIPADTNVLWLIHQGIVKTTTWDEEENPIALGYWGTGDVVGQPLSRVTPYAIKCLSYVEAACVPCQYWSSLSREIRCHHQDVEELLYISRQKTVHKKLIKFLIFLAKKFSITGNQGKLIKLSLTHQELADSIGTSRVTITRIINQLEQEGLIDRPNRNHISLRPALLEEFNLNPNKFLKIENL